jgi:hypothetical protein
MLKPATTMLRVNMPTVIVRNLAHPDIKAFMQIVRNNYFQRTPTGTWTDR